MLTELQCRKALPAEKAYKLADERGLYLFVTPTGFKSWRLKYRFEQKEKRLTFGPWPEVTLREARERRDDARRLLRDGIDPGAKEADTVPTPRQLTMRWLIEPISVSAKPAAGQTLGTIRTIVPYCPYRSARHSRKTPHRIACPRDPPRMARAHRGSGLQRRPRRDDAAALAVTRN